MQPSQDNPEPIVPEPTKLAAAGTPKPKRSFKPSKKLLMIVVPVVLVVGGSAAAYFGYFHNPGVIWQKSLQNSAQGVDKLLTYSDSQHKQNYKGISETGSVKFNSGDATYTGSLTAQTYQSNAKASFKMNVAGTDYALNTVSLKENDKQKVYLQATGLKTLEAFLGPEVVKLDGQWIVIDQSTIDQLKKQSGSTATTMPKLSWDDAYTSLKDLEAVNKQYVFTTDAKKSVTKVVKNIGFETVDGHKTYHYQVGFAKDNVKAYITAMGDSLEKSKLGNWIVKASGQPIKKTLGYDSLLASADKLKDTDTIDVWADTGTKVIYKLRVSDSANPAVNFADLGLNYKGGDQYPFFIKLSTQTDGKTQTVNLDVTLDTKVNSVAVKLGVNDANSKSVVSSDLVIKPSNDPVMITAPVGAITFEQALQSLGLGSPAELRALGL